jgi:small-conductance mechanosensitive channel
MCRKHNSDVRGFALMKVLRLLGLLIVLLLSPLVTAEVNNLPPDPTHLKNDWWNYFVTSPDKEPDHLIQHFATASERLSALRAQSELEKQTEMMALADAVISNLGRYQKFSAEPLPVPPLAMPAQEAYTLPEIRALTENLRKAGVAQADEAQEISLLQKAIAEGQRDLSQQKVDYRELGAKSPDRTRSGLLLMQSRLQLELAKLELAWRKADNNAIDGRIENLKSLVEIAAQRLTASEAAIDAAIKNRTDAAKKASQIRLQLLQVQLAQSGSLARTPLEQAQDRLARQRLVELDVQASLEEIAAAQSGLVEKILRRVSMDNVGDPKPDREYLGTYSDELDQVKAKLPEWRRITLRSRETALKRIPDETDKNYVALLEQRAELANTTERELRTVEEQLIGAVQFGDLFGSLLGKQESGVTRGLQVAEDLAGSSWGEVLQLSRTTLFEIGGTPVTAVDILRMLIILTAAWWVSKLLRSALQSIAAKRQTVNISSIYTLSRILHYCILAVGIMIALSSIGIDFTKFALFASALGVGIGFGLQTLVSNFVAGLIILFEKSLKISDFVELESGVTGEVREINMRSTLITTNDNIDIVVPNSEFVNGRVTNWTMREAFRRIHIAFGVAYGTDKELVHKAALEAANDVPVTLTGIKKREPQLWFVEFGDSSLNFELVVWLKPEAVKSPGAVHAKYLWEIDNKLRKYNIEVPFPQRDLHLRSVLGKHTMEELSMQFRAPE